MESNSWDENVGGNGVEYEDFIDSELEDLYVYVFLDILFCDFLRYFLRVYLDVVRIIVRNRMEYNFYKDVYLFFII